MVRTSRGGLRYPALAAVPTTWRFAALVVLAEALAALAGWTSLPLAAAALLAPGFALAELLPAPLRRSAVARALNAPILGLAATALCLISIARLGIPLTGISVRLVLVALVATGWFLRPAGEVSQPLAGERRRSVRVDLLLDVLGLTLVLALAFVLDWRVIGELPVPGDDWAKYVLYADEIRRNGTLLLNNELWMGGRPFSEDPGVPSLEGAALLMTGAEPSALVRVILGLQLLGLAAAFGAARAWFGRTGAIVTGALLAAVPASQNILGWHGLANVGALALAALVLAQLGAWLAGGGLDRRAEIGLAIMLVGVVAFHRFTALFIAGTLAAVLLAAAIAGPRRPLLLSAARVAGIGALGGVLVALDLRQRAQDAGGTLPYTSYLGTKVDLTLALRDLSPVLVATAVCGTVVLLAARRLPRAAWPALAMALVAVALAFGYVVHLPLYYSRVTFFLPLPLAILAGAGAGTIAKWWVARSHATAHPGVVTVSAIALPALLGALAGAALGVVSARSWRQAEQVRQYYAFATPQALRGLDELAARLRPNEIVATDRCWSFLATWLLHTRTYPALEEQDIQPKAELTVARNAAAILHGTAAGRTLMRELPVRYAVLDPTCPVNGRRFFPPGRPVFAGARLAIIELNPEQKNPPAPDRPKSSSRRARPSSSDR
jgi:hypothetical protein